MSVSGFEGFEKRLELRFFGDDPLGLRRLPISTINQVLTAVQCTIVSAVGNRSFDAYVLSESSLFVYPYKIIIKTCGTTQLLKAIPSLLPHTLALGLSLSFSRYSRGSFIFPDSQPSPHSCFGDEVAYLERFLPSDLCYRKACILPSNGRHSWHVFSASVFDEGIRVLDELTVEVCMTDLDRELASGFYRKKADHSLSGDEVGRAMTQSTGIDGINPRSLVCGFAFEPCGYSMNSLDGDFYSTIHVTPEDGFSYASFECIDTRLSAIADLLAKAVRVFGPGTVSVSVCGAADEEAASSVVESAIKSVGMNSRSRAMEDFPGAGLVTYHTFSARRK